VEFYESEREQLEALKKWWKENGVTILIGLAIGLGGVLAWTWWQSRAQERAESASSAYERLVDAIRSEDLAQITEYGNTLIEDFSSSDYASLAALLLAKVALSENDVDRAKENLEWVLQSEDGLELHIVARLRLARLMIDQDDYDGALSLIESTETGPFTAAYEEVRGDALSAKGSKQEARSAYLRSLANLEPTNRSRERIQMKLDDLGIAEDHAAQ
jgi:predicted negative regulator of RcsB-dependent stress response